MMILVDESISFSAKHTRSPKWVEEFGVELSKIMNPTIRNDRQTSISCSALNENARLKLVLKKSFDPAGYSHADVMIGFNL